MLKRERLGQVMNMVTEQNHISVTDLAKSLQILEMTIHRDFCKFYSLYDIDELVTNSQVSADVLKYYQQYTSVRTNIEA
ncbi:MAG: DeoR family transcriptional regulator [Lactobacillus delbrueckii]|nr:DeoR family transcriptional regulator [Lactobacillus delbrueckii]MCH4220214.1 DeoR family transcriptional regulator [Lactobacillus delbrueckii]MCH4253753.1 DeoR family transcriptional regulator [Lactobacillus delbrueckii]MCI1659145.1 DeoR family transcriptional regulator [Lactobacillus delbrueckii]MCI1706917.1 DeoR family transcriptional regulator [Lactobacillus delbrueckii]